MKPNEPADVACPQLDERVLFRRFGQESGLHDPRRDTTFVLNASATRIVELFDGSSTVAEVGRLVEADPALPADASAVRDLSDALVAQGLLDGSRPRDAAHRGACAGPRPGRSPAARRSPPRGGDPRPTGGGARRPCPGRPPEAALLLALSGGDGGTWGDARTARVDPDVLLELAHMHQVDALAHWHLDRPGRGASGTASLPDGVRAELLHAFVHNAMRNASLAGDLDDLQDAFRAKGIETLVFKGPWLAWHAWPDPGTRPIDDIDLGIREADYSGALEALERVGYRPPGGSPSTPGDALLRAHYREQLRFAAPGRRTVELHFRMVNVGAPRDEGWVWKGARSVDIEGTSFVAPGPDAMLLHVLLHANQHAFAVLRLLFDVRFALDALRGELDEEELLGRVRELRATASAYHAFVLAEELAGARVAARLLDALRPGPIRRWVFRRLWKTERARRLDPTRANTATEAARFCLLEMGSVADRIAYARGLARAAGGVRAFCHDTLRATRRSR